MVGRAQTPSWPAGAREPRRSPRTRIRYRTPCKSVAGPGPPQRPGGQLLNLELRRGSDRPSWSAASSACALSARSSSSSSIARCLRPADRRARSPAIVPTRRRRRRPRCTCATTTSCPGCARRCARRDCRGSEFASRAAGDRRSADRRSSSIVDRRTSRQLPPHPLQLREWIAGERAARRRVRHACR